MKSNPLSLRRRNFLGSVIAVFIMLLLYFSLHKEHRYTGDQLTTFSTLFAIVLVFHTWVIPAWKSPQARVVVQSIFSYSCFTALITGIANLLFLLIVDPAVPEAAQGYTQKAIDAQYQNAAAFQNPVLSSVIIMVMVFIITLTLTALSSMIIHGVKRKPAQLAVK